MIKNITINLIPLIDIITPVGEIGGVENCINMLGRFLTQKSFRIRVIQMLSKDLIWTDSCIEYHWFFPPGENHSIKEFADSYRSFIQQNNAPSVILAVAWPIMSYVARVAIEGISDSTKIIAWPHAPIEIYERANRGSYNDYDYADEVCAISRRIANSIVESNTNTLVYRINNPVKFENICAVNRQPSRTLLFVGRLSIEKNIPTLIGAIALASSKWKLRIVGDGKEKDSLVKLADEFGVKDRVHFMGWSKNPWEYAKDSYALVLASYFEGFPLVAIEALACGLPIIANKSSGLEEVIAEGKNGYIYEDDSSESLAFLLDKLSTSQDTISSEFCKSTAIEFDENRALFDFYLKIFATANNRILTDNTYKCRPSDILDEKISVIIPCYNVKRYLEKCLDSILAQSIGLEHIEIIAVNDASSDNTLEILCKYEKLYSDLFCVVNCEECSGPGFARNTGMNYASGQYITFIDSDDIVSKYMLEIMYLTAICYPANMISCDFNTFTEKVPSGETLNSYTVDLYISDDPSTSKALLLKNAFDNPVWGKLYRTSFLKKHSDTLFFPEGLKMEDIYFTYNSVALCNSYCQIKEKLYYYRLNPDGIMKSKGFKNYYMDIHYVFAQTVEAFRSNNIFDFYRNELAFAYYKKVFFFISMYMIESGGSFSKKNFMTLKSYMTQTFPDINKNPYLSEEDVDTLSSLLEL
jgi:glycosyltransferase involved in cell wall biosynthesis